MLTQENAVVHDLSEVIDVWNYSSEAIANDLFELYERTNANHNAIAKLVRKNRFKASKFGLLLAIAAGITYVIHNEYEKTTMKEQLITLDKRQRGLDTVRYTAEDEGEALDPI